MKWTKKGTETSIKEVFLKNIGVSSLDDVNAWFLKSYAGEYRIDKLHDAVELAKKFKDQKVTICGDYDVDGVTSTSILYLTLIWAGFKDVHYRIPRRFSEGFGINRTMIDEADHGLIITCDNGVAQADVIDYAKSNGITVIVTDHHEPQIIDGKVILPNADIIIDPHAIDGQADFDGYCGAGIAYKFACELLDNNKSMTRILLGLAAIGTIADVMELREENYVFVRNGLKMLNISNTTTGMNALISEFGLTKHITAKDVGFKIGPAINACSRMNDNGAKDAVECLTFCGDYTTAIAMAEKMIAVNEARKSSKKEALRCAYEEIENHCLYGDIPMTVYIPDTLEGIAGIVAGNLAEEYKIPVIVLTNADGGLLKGSARSYGNYNMKKELDKCSDILVKHGGHAGAAGLSILPENVDKLRMRLINNLGEYKCSETDVLEYDLEIKSADIVKVAKELEKYEPFGKGNATPIFKVTEFSVIPKYGAFKKPIGDGSIVKLYSKNATAIGFDMGDAMSNIDEFMGFDFIGEISNNYFNGNIEAQIEFKDFKKVNLSKVTTPLACKLKAMAMMNS